MIDYKYIYHNRIDNGVSVSLGTMSTVLTSKRVLEDHLKFHNNLPPLKTSLCFHNMTSFLTTYLYVIK